MRCEDVMRALAVPVEGRDAAALAEHLDHCSVCAEWSARGIAWDRLWDATRPEEPTQDAWDVVWLRVEQSLEQRSAHAQERVGSSWTVSAKSASMQNVAAPSAVAAVPFPHRSHRRFRFFATAAAAVLAAVGLFAWEFPPVGNGPEIARIEVSPDSTALHAIATVDIDEGQLVVIRSADPRPADLAFEVEVSRFEPDDGVDPYNGFGIDSWYVMFNIVESMANPVVASLDFSGR